MINFYHLPNPTDSHDKGYSMKAKEHWVQVKADCMLYTLNTVAIHTTLELINY